MDATLVIIIVSFSAIFITAFVLKVIFYRVYDKVRNDRAMRMNAQRPPNMSRLSERDNTTKPDPWN